MTHLEITNRKGIPMKMQKRHLDELSKAINKLLEENPSLPDQYLRGEFPRAAQVVDLQMRFSWDLFFMVQPTLSCLSDPLFRNLNDNHITTALKKIIPLLQNNLQPTGAIWARGNGTG